MKKLSITLLAFGFMCFIGTTLLSCKGNSDVDVQTALTNKAKNDPRLSGLTTTVSSGVVTIDGQCPDETCKTDAEQAVKEVKGVKSVVNNITITQAQPAPEISADSALQSGVRDATKDFPTVTATVANGEITLTGSVQKDQLPRLMQSLNSLNPRKINNQLFVTEK